MPRYDDYDELDSYDDIRIDRGHGRASGPMPQSGLGMASLGIAALLFILAPVLIVLAVMLDEALNNGQQEQELLETVVGLGLIGCLCLGLIGIVLGVVGCCQSDRSMTCGLLGAILNGLILFGVMLVVCAGLALGG